jgi:hypothetical protein
MGVDQPECGAGRASPENGRIRTLAKNKKPSENVDRRAVAAGRKLVVRAGNDLLAISNQAAKFKDTFQCRPYEQCKVLGVLV